MDTLIMCFVALVTPITLWLTLDDDAPPVLDGEEEVTEG